MIFNVFKKGAEVTLTEKVLTAGSLATMCASVITLCAVDYISKNTPLEVRSEGIVTILRYLNGQDVDCI